MWNRNIITSVIATLLVIALFAFTFVRGKHNAVADSGDKLRIATLYFNNIFAQNYQAAFDSLSPAPQEFAKSPASLKSIYDIFVNHWGTYYGIARAQESNFAKPNGMHKGLILNCRFEKGIKTIDVVFDIKPNDNKIYSVEVPSGQDL
jgi:hypothetical protein